MYVSIRSRIIEQSSHLHREKKTKKAEKEVLNVLTLFYKQHRRQ